MSEIAKHIGGALRRAYASVLKRPMPWNIIDKLTTLEEKCEAQDDAPKRADGANRDGAGDGRPSTSAAGNELPKTRS